MRFFSYNNNNLFAEEGFDDILTRYEEATSNNKTKYFDVDELEVIIDYYLQKDRTKDSSNAIELGLRLHPGSTPLQLRRARLYASLDKYEEALKIVEKINLVEVDDFDNSLFQGELLVKLLRGKEAEAIFDNLLLQESGKKDFLCLDIAYIFLNNMDFDLSLKYLLQGYEFNPKNIELLFELAFNYKQQEKMEEALDIYNQIIDINPYSSEAWFNLGQLQFYKGNYNEAIQAYDFVTTIDESDYLAWMQKGNAYFQNENYAKAIEAYQSYREQIHYEDATSLIYIGECYEKMEDFDQAINYYKQALEIDKINTDAYTGIGICLLEKELYSESIVYFQQAVELAPNISEHWVYLAEAYVNMEMIDEAFSSYQKALAIDDQQPDTLVAIGNLYLDKGDYEISLDYFLKAFAIDKDTEGLLFLLAVNYYKLEQFQQALHYLEEACLKDPQAIKLFVEIFPEAKEIL